MITNVNNATQMPVAPAEQSKSTSGPTTYHTPFGDVLIDHLTAPDMLAEFGGKTAEAKSIAQAAAQKAVTDAVIAPAAKPAVATTVASAGPAIVVPTPAPAAASPVAVASVSNRPPTPQSVFGPNPWVSNPGGVSAYGAVWQYNPIYFASQQTAEKVAGMVGGTVFQENAILGSGASPFTQNQENNMVKLPDGGILNPGLIAGFYDHGYSQSAVDQMIKNEVQGAEQDVQNETRGI